jgi:glutaminyl-tRNA synthetase
MPTICGMRERGYTPAAIKDFCERIGVAKSNSLVDVNMLEHCVREDLNDKAVRVMVVKDPLKLVIENFPEGKVETLSVENHPMHPEMGGHDVTFSREIYIERSDFEVEPPAKYYRLKPGGIVRLKGSYILEYVRHEADERGNVTAVYCNYVEDSKSGGANAGIKCKGVIHWVSALDAKDVIINEYDYLLDDREGRDFSERINRDSKKVIRAKAEAYLLTAKPYDRFQFMRLGYYMANKRYSPENPEFNSIVGLKDSFNK